MNICRSLSSQPTTVINLLIGSMGVKSRYIFEVFCNIDVVLQKALFMVRRCREPRCILINSNV